MERGGEPCLLAEIDIAGDQDVRREEELRGPAGEVEYGEREIREMKVLLVLMLLVVGVSLSGVRRQALGYADCDDDDIYGLQGHCGKAVWVGKKVVKPSADCCHFVAERTSLPCVCQFVVTRKHEKYISMWKLAHVAAYCGVPLKQGTQCGSFVVPPQL